MFSFFKVSAYLRRLRRDSTLPHRPLVGTWYKGKLTGCESLKIAGEDGAVVANVTSDVTITEINVVI